MLPRLSGSDVCDVGRFGNVMYFHRLWLAKAAELGRGLIVMINS